MFNIIYINIKYKIYDIYKKYPSSTNPTIICITRANIFK